MTIHRERIQSLNNVREFLRELYLPGKLPTKKELRHRIRYLMKHYPANYEIGLLPDFPTERQRKAFEQFKIKDHHNDRA